MAFPMTNYYIGSIIWLVQWISFHSLLSNYNKFIVHIYSESHTDEDLINVYQRNFFSFLSLRHSNMTFPRTLFEIISIYYYEYITEFHVIAWWVIVISLQDIYFLKTIHVMSQYIYIQITFLHFCHWHIPIWLPLW